MLNVAGWNHHRRAHNKMADALANMAVDSRRSVQRHIMGIDSVTSEWEGVLRHAAGEIEHWQERIADESPSGYLGPSHRNLCRGPSANNT
ncbi:hypothetical protein PC116_g25577 [Phytophthora cactorum]|uniref:Uncharacterized protein n=1 Tax=Phytophthora cactorum TaxID=29920 RepID=A0A8T1B1B5_9STRA|nr:hypothetical protein PC114_g23706 [Phytophthora cactorum]KAG2894359.1 hypothetical protein PC117_g23504 [Phytophthora cactorum]KAG2972214.1 hypothetical protein PC119_g23225 [Phytophthora cactorum]KAG2990496.1 hypothetical protein PC120_g22931 [Phytophthora cactorum]KAG3129832.1 hypothetical protein C6341_g23986 [Phytophthora cactorum]